MDQQMLARAWRQRGFSCRLWVDPPGQVWENFRHTVDELVMVIDGDLEVETEQTLLRPRPGEEVLIPAGVRHSVRNCGGTAAHWLFGYKELNSSET